MTGRFLGRWTPGSDEWHAARARRIGGSEIGAVMGWSPHETRYELLHRKAGLLGPRKTSAAMRRGHYCEGAVLRFLADKHSLTYAPDLSDATFVHADHEWALYNPDAVIDGGASIAEAKTTSNRSTEAGWGRAGTDQVPLHYVAQVTWGMGVLGATDCYLGVLAGAVNGRPDLAFASYRIRFDADLFTHLLAEGERFITDLHHLTERHAA